MQQLTVSLGERSYPIYVGGPFLSKAGALLEPFLGQKKVFIVSNTTVAPLYLDIVVNSLKQAGIGVFSAVLPDGEQHKNWETLQLIFDELLGHNCERGTTLVALGGGVIGDMGGFAAACYQRGMPFIQVPTTLLSQVDSSVGGKTAINHPLGKNMIGAFYQPKAVLADTSTLDTLPDRELSAGLAEVIKYGLIRDPEFLAWLESNIGRLRQREQEALIEAVLRSCTNKAEVVAADERESGERALLNLGHTFGHAIEAAMGYGAWLHGEAVAVGTMMAAELSRLMGWLQQGDVDRVENLMGKAGLPTMGPSIPVERYIELMGHDKKVVDGKLRLVVLRSLGEAVIADDAPMSLIREAIRLRTGGDVAS